MEAGYPCGQACEQELIGICGEPGESCFQSGGALEGFFPKRGRQSRQLFHVVEEFVIEEFVEKGLGDDFVLVAAIAQTVIGTDGLEVINEGINHLFLGL